MICCLTWLPIWWRGRWRLSSPVVVLHQRRRPRTRRPNPDHLHFRQRSRQDRTGRQPEPARRKYTGSAAFSPTSYRSESSFCTVSYPRRFGSALWLTRTTPKSIFKSANYRKQRQPSTSRSISSSASTPVEIDRAFGELANLGNGALLVSNDPYFVTRGEQLAGLAAHYKIPAMYSDRSYVKAGGLMSYGPSLIEAFREAAHYTPGFSAETSLPIYQSSNRPNSS